MRIAVIGTGGIGGVMAACLTRDGHLVSPIARDPEARAVLARDGYQVEDLDGTRWSHAVSSPPAANLVEARGNGAPFSAVILTTQAPALEEALSSAKAALAPETLVVVCQNGLPEARAAAVLPDARIVGCVVGWGASMVAPGRFKRTSSGGVQLGQLAGLGAAATLPQLEDLRAAMVAASPAELVSNFPGVRWSKLAINSVTSTLGAIGGQALGALLLRRPIRRLALEIFTEVADVALASGVTMAKVGGTLDISAVTLTQKEREALFGRLSLIVKHGLLLVVGAKFRRMRSSMLYALERGRPPEIDYLNGEIVRRGDAHGIATPVNRALVAEVRAIERGERSSSVAGLVALARELAR